MRALHFWDRLAVAALALALLVAPVAYVVISEVESAVSHKRELQVCLAPVQPDMGKPVGNDPCDVAGQVRDRKRNGWIEWGQAATSTFFVWLTCYLTSWVLVWIAGAVRSRSKD